MKQLQYSKTVKDLNGPKGLPVFGNIFELDKSKIHLLYEKWADEFGSLYNLNFFGRKLTVCTDPELNAYILKHRPTKFRRFKKMAEVIEEVGINGVFAAEGESWKKQRKVTQKALDNKNVRSFFPGIVRVADRLSNHWSKVEGVGNYEIDKDFQKATVDVTTNLAFGYDMNTVENDVDQTQEHIQKIFPKMNSRINNPIPVWRYIKTASDKEFEESMEYIRKVLGEFITNAQRKISEDIDILEHPTNFLEAMIASQDNDNPFTWDEIFGNLYTMLLAGEDTTSNSLSWITYFLAANPDQQQKVQAEIDAILKGQKLDNFDQLEAFTYTASVIKESMRIKPVTPQLYMQALEDVVIGDVFFPKGSFVITQLSHAPRSDKYFADASTFAPERWLENKEEGGCPYHKTHNEDAMKTFGGGARTCPGKFLSEVELKVFIIRLFQEFDVELNVAPEEVKEVFAFTMSPGNLKVKLKHRSIDKEKMMQSESIEQ
ncbi:cytochrome P450 [Flammeovirga sp. SJP92]|uniref:cytochrome P450 n=1 Tax=Flammeovirga sp. SJP92 TaxID=1775430 RepID=UPI000787FBDC|nr:cytochrome P450 [Flammeovirga sp. SJP92]KXX72354.1 hypothetical protein AVL50_01760 [Flammeovirga sp. SJP92]